MEEERNINYEIRVNEENIYERTQNVQLINEYEQKSRQDNFMELYESGESIARAIQRFKEELLPRGIQRFKEAVKALSKNAKNIFRSIRQAFARKKVRIITAIICGVIALVSVSAYGIYDDWFGRIGLNLAIYRNNDINVTNYIETRIERENLHKPVLKAIDYLVCTDKVENHNYVIDKILYSSDKKAEKYRQAVFAFFKEKSLFGFVKAAKSNDFIYKKDWLTTIYDVGRDIYIKYIEDSMTQDEENAKSRLENYYKYCEQGSERGNLILQLFNSNGVAMTDVEFLMERYLEGGADANLLQMLKAIDSEMVRKATFAHLHACINRGFSKENAEEIKKKLNKYKDNLIVDQGEVDSLITQVEQVISYMKEIDAIPNNILAKKKEKETIEKEINSIDDKIRELSIKIDLKEPLINTLKNANDYFTLTAYIVEDEGYSGGYHVYEIALLNSFGYPSMDHAYLYTKHTTYSSKGRFSLQVQKGGTESVRLKEEYGAFYQEWNKYYEVDMNNVAENNRKLDAINEEIQQMSNDISSNEAQKRELNKKISNITSEISNLEESKKNKEDLLRAIYDECHKTLCVNVPCTNEYPSSVIDGEESKSEKTINDKTTTLRGTMVYMVADGGYYHMRLDEPVYYNGKYHDFIDFPSSIKGEYDVYVGKKIDIDGKLYEIEYDEWLCIETPNIKVVEDLTSGERGKISSKKSRK